ncbi:MAG: right-handed parallel beta-helix repeat-containing protein [Nitrosomonas sp.]
MFQKSPAVYLFTILSALIVTPAQARPQTFVASFGNDANPCGRVLPCRLISRAMVETDTNGEVVVLDSANFLPITITKSITLTAPPGIYAGITSTVAGTSGVTIAANFDVVLRGLTINGLGGDNGILMNSNGNLSIENCVISNFSGAGRHGVLVTSDATVRMVDTLIRDNDSGIKLQGGGVTDISSSKFLGNNFAIIATSTSAPFPSVIVSDTIVTAGGTGIEAISSGTGNARISMIRTSVTNNLKGVASSASAGTAPVTLSESMVAGNLVGYFVGAGGLIRSLFNNTITDNGSNTGSLTTIPLQ